MPITTPEQRQRLINVIAWAAGEDAKAQLGQPSEWDQGEWLVRGYGHCGTVCCIAGRIALEDGATPAYYDNLGNLVDAAVLPGDDPDGEIERYAGEVLGLTWREANRLFNADNTLEDLLNLASLLLHGEVF